MTNTHTSNKKGEDIPRWIAAPKLFKDVAPAEVMPVTPTINQIIQDKENGYWGSFEP